MKSFAVSVFVIAFISDLLISLVYTVYRTLLDEKIVIPGAEDNAEERPDYERLLDDPCLMGKLAIGSRFFACVTAAAAMLIAVLYFPGLNLLQTAAVLLLIVVVIQLSEILLRATVNRHPRNSASALSGLCRFFSFIFTPFYLLRSKILPEPEHELTEDVEDEEQHLRDWAENIPENTLLEDGERNMIRSIVHFSNTMVREIMIPRVELDALDVDEDLNTAVRLVLDSGHSRLPVYEDEIDNMIGVLYAKDVLAAIVDQRQVSLRELLRDPLYTPESKMAGDLLSEMQQKGVHMAVVVDEYGGTSGIVSMEDIVEEIVGEIRDEYDEKEEEPVRKIDENCYSFLGRIDVEDVNEILGTHLTREAADTLAGYMYSTLGKVPAVGETVADDVWTFEIEELSGKRICRVRAVKTVPAEAEEEKSDDSNE